MYDYKQAVLEDVREYIMSNYDEKNMRELGRDDFYEKLFDELWVEDSVTGNASGSYTFNTWEAEENICHNWDLLVEAANEFGIEPVVSESWKGGAEYWDVTIRCYLLPNALSTILDEYESDGAFDEE